MSTGARDPSAFVRLSDLFDIDADKLQGADIAQMNLVCAQGLPGAENLEVPHCLSTLDSWTGRIASETDRNLYRFNQNPKEFENSEGYFRMMMLVTVLQQDFGVHYHQERVNDPDFSKSGDLFIHGLLGDDRVGTCASMPVLYVALGRRLGYPLSLVLTKEHVFLRWKDAKERFNIEATSRGITSFSDEYYTTWPHRITHAEIERYGYLKSLTPPEELSLFLSSRGDCLEANGRPADAQVAYALAHRVAPQSLNALAALAAAARNEEQRIAGLDPSFPSGRATSPSPKTIQRQAAEVEALNAANLQRWAEQFQQTSP